MGWILGIWKWGWVSELREWTENLGLLETKSCILLVRGFLLVHRLAPLPTKN